MQSQNLLDFVQKVEGKPSGDKGGVVPCRLLQLKPVDEPLERGLKYGCLWDQITTLKTGFLQGDCAAQTS